MIKRSPSDELVPHCTIINDCLSCIQVWCIEGNPTTRRIKVDSSYLLPSITTPALAF